MNSRFRCLSCNNNKTYYNLLRFKQGYFIKINERRKREIDEENQINAVYYHVIIVACKPLNSGI